MCSCGLGNASSTDDWPVQMTASWRVQIMVQKCPSSSLVQRNDVQLMLGRVHVDSKRQKKFGLDQDH